MMPGERLRGWVLRVVRRAEEIRDCKCGRRDFEGGGWVKG